MTFAEIRQKIISRWWLILAFTLGFTLAFYPWSSATNYQASIGIGLSFNNSEFIAQATDQNLAYVESLSELSLYLSNRFKSVEVQSNIAKTAGLPVGSFNSLTAFYDVVDQSGGYITISYIAGSQEEAERFLDAVEIQYNRLVELERSNFELANYQINPKSEFISDVSPVQRGAQFRLLPSVAGLMLGLAIATIVPYRVKP